MAVDDALAAFVRDALARGESRDRIRAVLRTAGWDDAQVTRALDAWALADFPVPVPRPRPYVSAAEAFQYLVLFSTLHAVAINLGVLGLAFIDAWVPDPAASPWASAGRRGAVRSAIAAIVIAAPVFAFTARILSRGVATDPTKRQSRVRKWLTYLTMFIAAGVVVGDAIALVNEFLAGELTLRFALRVLVVGGLAGSVFAWYLRDVRRDDAETVADLEELARSVDIQWTRRPMRPAAAAGRISGPTVPAGSASRPRCAASGGKSSAGQGAAAPADGSGRLVIGTGRGVSLPADPSHRIA
jgi:hypothetical protein